jgi:ribonuclease P protein component
MIHRTHRFHGRSSLRYVYQRGKTLRTPLYSLRFVPNTRRSEYRVAVVVSRKVNKSAVVRNRIRRRIYEIVREQDKSIVLPYDLVFTIFSDQLAELESTELSGSIAEQFEKAGIFDTEYRGDSGVHAIVKPKEQAG